MDITPSFDKYMDRYFEYAGQWDCPSKCGLRVVPRKDGKIIVIATEIYRQNPGTPVTEWCAPLATEILKHIGATVENFIFIEHTPDLKSTLSFYEETFDRVDFDWNGEAFSNPRWTRLSKPHVDAMMEE